MTAKRKYPGPDRAPYRQGSLQEYAGWGEVEWRDNDPFKTTLVLVGTERGRSAMRFIWRDQDDNRFPMFATDMAALAMSALGVDHGVATGQWIVMKRGANYGIARYEA